MTTGTLYLIPNTLGLRDAHDPLASVIPTPVQSIAARLDYYIVENAKTARAYLKKVAENTPLPHPLQQIEMVELNARTPASALATLLTPLLQGRDAGLISEAGVPAVADPGANLVRHAHSAGIPVRPLVGPSSLLLALMASGLNGQSFAFQGYLPIETPERRQRILGLEAQSRQSGQTQLFIETPYRNAQLLEALVNYCQADTLLCTATDLTLNSERIISQPVAAWRTMAKEIGASLNRRPTVFLLLARAS